MFDLKDKVDAAVKLIACTAAAAAAGVAALFFFCVALFVWTEQHYGTVTASLVLAILFLVVTIAALTIALIARRPPKDREPRANRAAAQSFVDPMVITSVLEVLKTVGGKRAMAFLAGAFVIGTLLARPGDKPSSTDRKP